jgi:hypothetical protein
MPAEIEKNYRKPGVRAASGLRKTPENVAFSLGRNRFGRTSVGWFMEIEGSITAIAEAEMFLGIEYYETEHATYPHLTMKYGVQNEDLVEARF